MTKPRVNFGGVLLAVDEVETLRLASEGLLIREIAPRQSLSIGVVSRRLGKSDPEQSLLLKIGVESRAAAVRFYLENTGEPKESVTSFGDEVRGWPTMLHQQRMRGDPKQAVSDAPKMLRMLSTMRASPTELFEHSASASEIEHVLLVGAIQYEYGMAHHDAFQPEVIQQPTQGIVKRIRSLAKRIKDRGPEARELAARANVLIGNMSYLVGNYPQAAQYLNQAIPDLRDANDKLFAMRVLATDFARLGDKARYLHIQGEIKALIDTDTCSYEMVSFATGGLGLAGGLLRLSSAIHVLEEARHMTEEFRLLHLGILRSLLRVVPILAPEDKGYIMQVGDEAKTLASETPGGRYVREIDRLLEKSLG